jgi:DNA-binding SARP family transcriptional activator
MWFAILGPLEAYADGQRLALGGPQQRALLAALLLNSGRVVSTDRLVECLWGEQPPPAARSLLQGCVAGLRRALEGGPSPDRRLITRAPGYLLEIRDDELDVDRFERLVAAATRDAGDRSRAAWERSAALLGEALSLWRGPVLDGVAVEACQADVARLAERHLAVLEQRIDADLRVGRYAGLVGELESLVREHPLRERIWAQLIVALYGADRQADALARYQRLRRTLVDQLGVEPGATLRHLHGAILAGRDPDEIYPLDGDGTPAPDPAPSHPPARAVTAPAQLPAAVAAFAGRGRELAYLDRLLTGNVATPTAVVVSAVSGTAGVGKTALAVHWAHRVAERFPDGQLYVNLRGFDPCRPPMEPVEAVRGFLDAFGVPNQRIPLDLDAQTGLYRSLLAGKRVLVVLDNARSAEQVRPLLPGAPGCLTIVTSRNQLTPLVATDGARPLALGLLTEGQARDLLTLRLGRNRTAAEPDAVTEIIARCARLPLALAIAAARAETSTGRRLTTLAEQLRDTAGALDTLDAGDPATDVRAVFSWSYHALGPEAARMFRLLGLHPGPDFTAAAAASLAGVPSRQASLLLIELVRAHLLTEQTPGRYTFHDLLRAYAAEQAHIHDSDEGGRAAAHRMLDHYLHTTRLATVHLYRQWISVDGARAGVIPEQLTDDRQAMTWLIAEHRVLLAAVEYAAANGFEGHSWRLASTLTSYLQQRCHWPDWGAVQRIALDAAERAGDLEGQAHAHHGLGSVLTYLGRYDDAHAHLLQSLDQFAELGDKVGQARVHLNIGILMDQRGGADDEGLSHDQVALEMFRSAGHRVGQAIALNNIGWAHAQLGQHRHSLFVCQQALDLLLADGSDREGLAGTWDSLGYAHHHLGNHEQAIGCYTTAAQLYRDAGNRYYEAATLIHVGSTHQAAGDHTSARLAWQLALRILDELDHPEADDVRAKLQAVPVTR